MVYRIFVEKRPGQFDQRADSAAQCIQLISRGERPLVRSAKVYALSGDLSEEEMALVHRCVESYKGFRDVIFNGDLYRLGSPYGQDHYGLVYVSPDKSRAVAFVYAIRFAAQGGEGVPFRLKGLDPDKRYKVTEQNVDHSCWWGDGGTWSGAFLGSGAFNPRLPALYSSAVFLLEEEL